MQALHSARMGSCRVLNLSHSPCMLQYGVQSGCAAFKGQQMSRWAEAGTPDKVWAGDDDLGALEAPSLQADRFRTSIQQ